MTLSLYPLLQTPQQVGWKQQYPPHCCQKDWEGPSSCVAGLLAPGPAPPHPPSLPSPGRQE